MFSVREGVASWFVQGGGVKMVHGFNPLGMQRAEPPRSSGKIGQDSDGQCFLIGHLVVTAKYYGRISNAITPGERMLSENVLI